MYKNWDPISETWQEHPVARVNDKVRMKNGNTFIIGKVLYQDLDCSSTADDAKAYRIIEFVDSFGNYHSWKQRFDGGYYIQSVDNMTPEEKRKLALKRIHMKEVLADAPKARVLSRVG